MKKLQSEVKKLGGNSEDTDIEDRDYDDIGKNFILIGGRARLVFQLLMIRISGAQDPLSLRFECTISDEKGTEHKSAERYYWWE